MQGPITGIGPFNTFTLCSRLQLLTLERDHSSINASARQKLTAAIKADKAFPSVQALRLPTEPAITDFVSLYFRVKAARDGWDRDVRGSCPGVEDAASVDAQTQMGPGWREGDLLYGTQRVQRRTSSFDF